MTNIAVISIGSNIEPEKNAKKALRLLASAHKILAKSAFIRTKPIGFKKQPYFLNGVALIRTRMPRAKLNRWLKKTEKELGRVKTKIKGGPRTIDLDIITWNNRIVHEDFSKKWFVKKSMEKILPAIEKSLAESRKPRWVESLRENA